MKDKLVIATRQSVLALWQAKYIRERIQKKYPHVNVELLPVTTKGDEILDRSLLDIGGKGLFIKELEILLLQKKADIAVHSLKDMTADIPEGLKLAAVTDREDPRDAFVSDRYDSLEALPPGAVVGTASLRRQAQILYRRPDLQIKTLRGNVQTRLRQLEEGHFDAIILAAAGLKRLGLEKRITSYIETEESIPAAGQGVMAVEMRADDAETSEIIRFLHNAEVASCITAERAFLGRVGGDCKVPAGIYAVSQDKKILAEAFIASPDGKKLYRRSREGLLEEAGEIGAVLAEELLSDGGDQILKDLQKL